jgi:hypothetical protein
MTCPPAHDLAAAVAIYHAARREALEAGARHRLLVRLGSRASDSARYERECAVLLALEARRRLWRIRAALDGV